MPQLNGIEKLRPADFSLSITVLDPASTISSYLWHNSLVHATLPPEQRQVIALAYLAGFTHTQIAVRLGIPLRTVKARIRYGMTKLRSVLRHSTVSLMELRVHAYLFRDGEQTCWSHDCSARRQSR